MVSTLGVLCHEYWCTPLDLIPEVGDSPEAIDDAMKMGYNWIKGPFELIDEIGSDYLIQRLEKEQRNVPDYLKTAKGKRYYNGLDVLTDTGRNEAYHTSCGNFKIQ